ncbi:DUF3352 domain-containing protein [Fulvivirga sp.]|uniref:DUF3352 domain-containing protein n=1 Tax=Fulvivirga sp. TaxID=1931237 RepID=UPI0032EFEFCB
MKKFIIILLVLGVLLGGAYLYFFHLTPIKKNNPLASVPSNAAIIVSMDNPLKQWQRMTDNDIWDYLKTNPFLSSIGKSIDSLNTEIKKNSVLWDLTAARPMVISFHNIRDEEYEILYTVDLQKATPLSFLKDYIGNIIGNNAKVYTREYQGTEIIEFSFNNSPEVYYLSLNGNLLIFSTTHALIEKSIEQQSSTEIIRNLDFIEVSKYMDADAPTIYLQQKDFAKFLEKFSDNTEQKETLKFFTYSNFMGLNTNVGDNYITINGYSDLPDNEENLLLSLLDAGKGEINLGAIVPENASTFMSLGFSDAKRFYNNLEVFLEEGESGEEYEKNKEKLEKFLDISIEEHIISWIDNEMGLIQLNSNSDKNKVEMAVAIRYNDLDKLNENLELIETKIRRKTPVKFKGIDYKGYSIKFLSIKGFFKLIFGKMFSSIDKPYYVVLEDYIVFSNSPKTLGKIITANLENKTLNSTKEYAEFMEEFDHESNIFIYASAEELLTDAKRVLDDKSWSKLRTHKKYIEGFPLLGIQLLPDNGLLSYKLQMKHLNNIEQENWQSLLKELSAVSDASEASEDEVNEDYIIAVENILPEDLNDKKLTENFANGQLKFEVPLKDGLKHGRYDEYDSLGNLIIKGRYKNDKKAGTWKFYDSEGKLVDKVKE